MSDDSTTFDDRFFNNLPDNVKLTPVDDPWERAAQRTAAPYQKANQRTSGLPDLYTVFRNRVVSGATAPMDAFTGKLQVSDPETGMPTQEAMQRAQDVAALGGPGGLAGTGEEAGLALGSGPIRDLRENYVNPNKYDARGNYTAETKANVSQQHNDLSSLSKEARKEGVDIDAHWDSSDPYYQLSWVESKGLKPRAGFNAVQKLTQIADKNGKGVEAVAIPGTEGFYKKLGFENTGEEHEDGLLMRYNPSILSDTQKPGMIMSSIMNKNERAPPFYSALENAVANTKQQKMPADQWLGTISNSKGVKPEEMDWTGFKDYLTEKGKAPVTKDEVQDFINSNKVQLNEVNKGKNADLDRWQELNDMESKTPEERAEYEQLTRNSPNMGETKYSQYQLPGADPGSYKEMLLTLPGNRNPKEIERITEIGNRLNKIQDEFDSLYSDNPSNEILAKRKELFQERNRLKEEQKVLSDKDDAALANSYRSSHWNEPNPIAHVRSNTRDITAPGETEPKKSLHLEEIQSDWHQEGRDKGYRSDYKFTKEQENEMEQLRNELKGLRGAEVNKFKNNEKLTDEELIKSDKWKRFNELQIAKENSKSQGVPDAPFKKSWHELVLKRMIREAAEKGYDRLSWTPGGANKTNPKNLGQTGEQAEKADRGLKRWYDEIIPQALEKIGKEYGVKVKEGKTEGNYDEHKVNKDSYDPPYRLEKKNSPDIISRHNTAQEAWDRAEELTQRPVHYIDIPQKLKDTALGKGFPLFSGGFLLTPVNGDPHKAVNNSNHVPYGAGASNTPTGYPVNIDSRIPQFDPKLKLPNGQPADLHKYLTVHEIEEYKAMKNGVPYAKAHHEIATPMEKKAVESDGVDWREYEHVLNGYLKETEEGGYKNLPPNLYTKPYPHSRALHMDHGQDNKNSK